MGNLPAHRVQADRPFAKTGVDFCGPVKLTYRIRGKPPYKSYIAVFVCFTTKSVHLELVTDLSSSAFIACLKRFVARRGLCEHLYCDNGTNFVGARRELVELREQFIEKQNQRKMSSWCSSKGIEFHHIPPNAPHFGGWWEAAVKSSKHHLYRTLQNSLLTAEEMVTLLAEIEAMLNSRPLCSLSSDPNDEEVLTPGHFLIGCPINAIPEPTINTSALPCYQRWRHISMLKQHFWRRWSREYLLEMQQRNKWQSRQKNVTIGALVLIADDNTSPQQWLVGRITNIIHSTENEVRVVDIRTNKGQYRRPIHRIAVLPIEVNVDSTEVESKAAACSSVTNTETSSL